MSLKSSALVACILLAYGIEVKPLSVELCLALARLECPDIDVLNKARRAFPRLYQAVGRLLDGTPVTTSWRWCI
ncbi:hypothetical protein CPC08DRAFT_715443 [Agrocybe pediades]|nr:hypothetical protein CPC08DRAFT_715443 [Agrocybe pediades]